MHFYSAYLVRVARSLVVPAGVLALMITTGCGSSNWSAQQQAKAPTVAEVAAANTTSGGSTGSATSTSTSSSSATTSNTSTTTSTVPPVLLFIGTGTSSGDVTAVRNLLASMKLGYATATSSQLNAMSETQMRKYKLIFVPGGNAITISKSLTHTATSNIRSAVVNGGVHYMGICAGAFLAGNSGIYNYLALESGVWFNFYEDEFKGITKAALQITNPNGTKLDQYWQNGPNLSGWGSIVGKYPDHSPAIVEGKAGAGWVILCGVHPEAPDSWRSGMSFTTSAAVDNAYAKTMVAAALSGAVLPHF